MRNKLGFAFGSTLACSSDFKGPGGRSRSKFPPDETLSILSLTFTDDQFLKGDKGSGTPVTVTGELRFPSWGDHLPAVVLLHSSAARRCESGTARHLARLLAWELREGDHDGSQQTHWRQCTEGSCPPTLPTGNQG